MVFCGTAFRPPAWLKERYHIDLEPQVHDLYAEIPIQPLPEHLIGAAAKRIMESARALGLDWKPLDKFIRPEKCKPNCGRCSLGCSHKGAKWTAREFMEEAANKGARVLLQTKVDRVISENGKAAGVRAKDREGWLDIMAKTVVLSAGGQGTPPILQRSGVYEAGQGFFADPLWFVSGASQGQGSMYDIPMTAGINMDQDGIVLTDFNVPAMMHISLMAYSGVRGLACLPKLRRMRKMLTRGS